MDVPEAALGAAWTDERPWSVLTDLAAMDDRMAGRAGERRAAERVAAAFEAAGAREAGTATFDVATWRRGGTEFGVSGPAERSFEAVALPYSPGGEVSGPLVDLGHATPEAVEEAGADVEGAVVLARTDSPDDYDRFLHRMEKFGHAVTGGASAFVFRNHVPGQLPPTGSLRFGDEAAVPGVGVSRETGAWLAEYAEQDATAHVSVDAATDPGTGHSAAGVLGPADGEVVVLVAHLDAHDLGEGALDNAAGVAVLVGAARVLAASDLDVRVRLAGVGGEEVGLVGADALARELDLGDVRAVVNVDGAGRHRDLVAHTHQSGDVRAAVEAVADRTGQPVTVEADAHPFSDHWPFLRRGVPALQLHSDSGEAGRGWGHTAADTRDKVDPRNLRTHAMLTALLVAAVADRDPARVDGSALAAHLRERGLEAGMRASDVWPSDWD